MIYTLIDLIRGFINWNPANLQTGARTITSEKTSLTTQTTELATQPNQPTQINKVNLGLKKALLIGINYFDTKHKLDGCINDVNNMETLLLEKYKSSLNKSNIKILTDLPECEIQPTKTNIIEQIEWLVADLKPGENVYFHYSGHGGLSQDWFFIGDEKSGYDSFIYPINNKNLENILDDELRKLLVEKIPAGSKCFAVFDCCHSGTALDLKYKYNCVSDNSILMSIDNNYTDTFGSVVLLSGCSDEQISADIQSGKPGGALTNALISLWKKSTNITWAELLLSIRELLKASKLTQNSQLTSGQKKFNIHSTFDLGTNSDW